MYQSMQQQYEADVSEDAWPPPEPYPPLPPRTYQGRQARPGVVILDAPWKRRIFVAGLAVTVMLAIVAVIAAV